MKIVSLTPESVAHALKGMYRSFQQCGAGATLASDKFKLTQFAERDENQPGITTHVRLTGQGDLKGYQLQITGPAVDTGDNPTRSLQYWFGGNQQAFTAIGHLLSAFGDEIDIEDKIPFLNQVVRLKEDVNATPADLYCHIVVGRDPCTGDLLTFRAESGDKKFRINTIKSQDIKGLTVAPAELETAIRVAFMMQRLGPKDLATLIDKSAVDQLWGGRE
ncbi:hypothetical protein pAEv1812_53 [Aeromonas phage pAEv1812]|nr:hypothetical protein pAEv1812_53 [Aeromonas phage pAEv1812]